MLDVVPRVRGVKTAVAVVTVCLWVVLDARVAPPCGPVPGASQIQRAAGPLVRDHFHAVGGHAGVDTHEGEGRGLAPRSRGQLPWGLHAAQGTV